MQEKYIPFILNSKPYASRDRRPVDEVKSMRSPEQNAVNRLIKHTRRLETLISFLTLRIYDLEDSVVELKGQASEANSGRLDRALKVIGVPVSKAGLSGQETIVGAYREPPCPGCGKEFEEKMTLMGNSKALLFRCLECDAVYRMNKHLELEKWDAFSR